MKCKIHVVTLSVSFLFKLKSGFQVLKSCTVVPSGCQNYLNDQLKEIICCFSVCHPSKDYFILMSTSPCRPKCATKRTWLFSWKTQNYYTLRWAMVSIACLCNKTV